MALRSLASRRAFSLMSVFEHSAVERLHYLKSLPKHETYDLPWSFTGYPDQEPNIRYMADRCLIQTKTSLIPILGNFHRMYTAVLNSLVAGDLTPVDTMLESNLKLKLEMILSSLRAEGKSIQLTYDKEYEKQHPRPTVNVHDAVIYRGLSHVRTENDPLEAYHVACDKDIGVAFFTHADLADIYAYVDQKKIEKLFEKNRQCLLQYLVCLKTPIQLHLINRDGTPLSKYSPNYTFGQEWIFENQMIAPPKFKNEDKLENYMDWISKHKLAEWRISDMGGVMDGNQLAISQKKPESEKTKEKN